LVKGLTKGEKSTIRGHLVDMSKGKAGKTVELFALICKKKRWTPKVDEQFKKELNLKKDRYYVIRGQLGEWLLKTLGNMQYGPIQLRPFYEYAVEVGLLDHVLKSLVKDVHTLLEKEDFAEAVHLMELAEDAIQRNYGPEEAEKISHLPAAHTIRSWDNEIAEMRHGIQRVRVAIKRPMAERLVIAEELWEEYANAETHSKQGKLFQKRLLARIAILGNRLSVADSLGLEVISTLKSRISSKVNTNLVLDEYQYMITNSLDLEKLDQASQLIMQLPLIPSFNRCQDQKIKTLECRNLIAISIKTESSEWAKQAEQSLIEHQKNKSSQDFNSWWYSLALVHFSQNNFKECNLILNRRIEQRSRTRSIIHWASEFLMALSLFMREETELPLRKFNRLSSNYPESKVELPSVVCQMLCRIIKKTHGERSEEIKRWRDIILKETQKPSSSIFLRYFDIVRFLDAYQDNTSMATISQLRNSRNSSLSKI